MSFVASLCKSNCEIKNPILVIRGFSCISFLFPVRLSKLFRQFNHNCYKRHYNVIWIYIYCLLNFLTKKTGIDISPDMLNIARKKCTAKGLKVDLQTMNIEHLLFPDNYFNAAFSMAAFGIYC